MFSLGHFGNNHFAMKHFFGGGTAIQDALITASWRLDGTPLSNTQIDYWVLSPYDGLITNGQAATNAQGSIDIAVPDRYYGQRLLMVVNNIGIDMDTSERYHGQKVLTASWS